jgi:hypothetical protein
VQNKFHIEEREQERNTESSVFCKNVQLILFR